ncbi:MAG: glutathione S-transferase family protein [Pseudomonadota bacterium]
MFRVWGRATSSNVQKVMWVLAELGEPVERIDVGGAFGGLDTVQYRAMNPHGRIPTVEMPGGIVMWESNAITRHLARHDPQRRLWPAGGQAEADAEMWADWAHHAVVFPTVQLFWALVRTRPADRDAALIASHLNAANAGLAVAEKRLSQSEHLAGPTRTIADIVLGHILYRYYEMEIERPDLPALAAYYGRLTGHAPYAEHVMVDFSSLIPAP